MGQVAAFYRQSDYGYESCANCGMVFGAEKHFFDQRRGDHQTFYCPNGHSNYFPGETAEEKLRRQLAAEQNTRRALEQQNEKLRKSDARLKKRIAAGTCPCCKRTFSQLTRHMASQHPEFKEAPHART